MIQYEKYEPLIKGPFTNISDAIKEAGNALRFIKLFVPTAKIIIGGSLPFYVHYADKTTQIVMNDLDAALYCNKTSSKMVYAWASSRPEGTFKVLTRSNGKNCYIVPIGDLDLHIEHPDTRQNYSAAILSGILAGSCRTSETDVFIYGRYKTYDFYRKLNREKDQNKLKIMKKVLDIP